MNELRQAVLRYARNHPESVLLRTWPIYILIIALTSAEIRASAEALFQEFADIRDSLPSNSYAQLTRRAIFSYRSRLGRVERQIRATLSRDKLTSATRIDELVTELSAIKGEIAGSTDQDSRWYAKASLLRQRRRELATQVSGWSPAWQRSIFRTFSAVDSILGSAPRSVLPDEDLNRAEQRLDRTGHELKQVMRVARWHAAEQKISKRMQSIQPNQFAPDLKIFHKTMEAAGSAFNHGDYTASSQHYLAAFALAAKLTGAERLHREKGRSQAKQWLAALGTDEQAASLSGELSAVIAEPDGSFIVKWEEIHDRIRLFCLKRAIEAGNRDQRVIARGIFRGQIVHWGETLKLDEITRFAEIVARDL